MAYIGVGDGESGSTPEPNTNGGVRQSSRKRRSPKPEDPFSGATNSTSSTGDLAGDRQKSVRRYSSGSEKRNTTEGMENQALDSAKPGVAKRQSTRTRTPRQHYQELSKQGSEKVRIY